LSAKAICRLTSLIEKRDPFNQDIDVTSQKAEYISLFVLVQTVPPPASISKEMIAVSV
jgi:hypothetical protein